MAKKSSRKTTRNAQAKKSKKEDVKRSPWVQSKPKKGKGWTPARLSKHTSHPPPPTIDKNKVTVTMFKGSSYSGTSFSFSTAESPSIPIDLSDVPKSKSDPPNPQKGSGKLKVDEVTDKHLSNAGVSRSRPEMIMQLNFQPAYRGNRGTTSLPVKEVLDLQMLARQLHVESVGKMVEELADDERLENEIEIALDRYDAIIKDVRVDVGYLVGLLKVIRRIKKTLSVKNQEERILKVANRILKRRGGGVRQRPGGASRVDRSLDTLSQIFIEDLGFSQKGYDNFSGSKILGQLIYDLRQALLYFSPRMFDYSDPSRFRDVDPLLVNTSPGVKNEDYIFTMTGIADFDITDGGARDFWETMLDSLPTKKEQRSAILMNSLLKELKASNRATSKRFLNWADNFSDQLGDEFVDALLGDPSELFDSRSTYTSGMAKFIVPKEVDGYNVLPFENAIIRRDDESYIPGGIYYAEGMLQNDDKLNPGEYRLFAQDVFKYFLNGGGLIGQIVNPMMPRRRSSSPKRTRSSGGNPDPTTQTSAKIWPLNIGGAMNGMLKNIKFAMASLSGENPSALGFLHFHDAPVIRLAQTNKDVRWHLFRWCVTYSNHQSAIALGDYEDVVIGEEQRYSRVAGGEVTVDLIEKFSPWSSALDEICQDLRQAVLDELRDGVKGDSGFHIDRSQWLDLWSAGRFGGFAHQLLEQMRSLREGSRGAKKGGPYEFQTGNTMSAKYQPRTRWNNVTYDATCFLAFEFMMTSLDMLISNDLAFSVKYRASALTKGFRINSSGEGQQRETKAGYWALMAFFARDPDEESVAEWKRTASNQSLQRFESIYEYLDGVKTRVAGEVTFIMRAKAILQSVGTMVRSNSWATSWWIRSASRGHKRKQRQLQHWKTHKRGHMILETLSRQQLILRQVAIDHYAIRKDDELKLPAKSLIFPQQMFALDAMLQTRRFRSPRADNLNILAIGMPTRMIDFLNARTFHVGEESTLLGNKKGDVIQVRVYKRDLEYDDIVFKPQTYTFDMSLFLSGKFSYEDLIAGDDFQNIAYNLAKYRNYRPQGLMTSLTGEEIIESHEYASVLRRPQVRAMLRNHLRSDLLKTYIKVLTGINLDEQIFEIDEELFQEKFTKKDEEFIRKIVSTFLSDEGIETEEQMREFQETIKMIKTLTQSVLLSGKTYSTSVRSPTIFDRIFCIPVDPDDFTIDVSSTITTESGRKALYTVLFGKKIKKIKRRGATILKMKERKRNEGKISMYDYFVTIQVVSHRKAG